MSALTSLLVRDHVLSVRQIEMALERQVTEGSDVESALLEMDAVPENVLAAYRAVIFGLLPGTRDEVMKAPREVVLRVPRALALKHQLVPLSSDGKLLVVAVAEPLSAEARREVQEAVREELAYRIVTPVRLAAALAHHYEGELDGRVRRLVERLRNRAPGIVPYVAPPPAGGRVRAPTPVVAMRAADPEAVRAEATGATHRRGVPVWGPLTAKRAEEVLAGCHERDQVLDLALAFAKQFLDYVAVFVVQGDLAAGWACAGDGPPEDTVRALAVPLDVPGSFAELRERRHPVVLDLTARDLDRLLAQDLGRTKAQPSLLLPVMLKDRVVLVLYGDRAGQPFGLAEVAELVGLGVRVGDALERIIREKKERISAIGLASPGAATEVRKPEAERLRPGRRDLPFSSLRPPEPGPHGVLGVPRAAPVPPRASSLPDQVSAPAAGPAPTPAAAPAPAPAPRDTAAARASVPPGTGVYRVQEPVQAERLGSERPRPQRPSTRPDARRDDDASAAPREEKIVVPERISLPPKIDRTDPTEPDAYVAARAQALPKAASKPPARISQNPPNIIVNMGEAVERMVEDLLRCAPEEEGAVVERMLRHGEPVLPALVQLFPGRLWFDRREPHVRLPRGRDVSAAARALVAFGSTAVPYVTALLSTPDVEARFYAVLLAGEFTDPQVIAKVAELILDPDPGTRQLALGTIRRSRDGQKAVHEALKQVRNQVKNPKLSRDERERAVSALGELRDARSIPDLISLLEDREPRLKDAAQRALSLITRQDFGASQKRWQQWLEQNDDRHRLEWLADAMLHSNEHVRAEAGEELAELTGKTFGFQVMSARREREASVQRFRDWWIREGFARHGKR